MTKVSLATARRGQSSVEFIFMVMFFMVFVGFVRAMVYFELDVFNETNVARYNTLNNIRGSDESTQTFGDVSSPQTIKTRRLRPIPFIEYPGFLGGRGSDYTLPSRTLKWKRGTKGGDCGAPLGCSVIVYVLMSGVAI